MMKASIQKLAFTAINNEDNSEIFVVNTDGTDLKNITNYRGIDKHINWSSDGSRIVFSSNRVDNETYDIFVMNPDGSEINQLSFESQNELGPVFSPDDRYIGYNLVSQGSGSGDIRIMDANGENIRSLPGDNVRRNIYTIWSPDSQRIAYITQSRADYKYYLTIVDKDFMTTPNIVTEIDDPPYAIAWRP